MTALRTKNKFIKFFIIPFIFTIFPSVIASIDREIAEFCLKAEDFSGCVEQMSEKTPSQSNNSNLKTVNKNKNNKSDLFNKASSTYLIENNYLSAINYLDDLIRSNSKDSDAFFIRGIIKFLEMQDYQNALLDIQKSIELDAQDSAKYMSLGYVKYIYFEEHEAGLEDLNKALSLDPQNSLAYLFRGKVNSYISDKYVEKSDYKKVAQYLNASISDYSKSLEHYTDDFNPYFKRLYPFGYLNQIYGSRGRQYYNLGIFYKSVKEIKNKDLSKSSLNASLSDFDEMINIAPTIDDVENLNNPIKILEKDFVKVSAATWKGDTYSHLKKWASACRNWKKAYKTWNKSDYDVISTYKSLEDGFIMYETNCP